MIEIHQGTEGPRPELPQYIDSTMRSAFVSCHQKFYDEFILGLRPASLSIDLHAGAAFSGALEVFYNKFWVEKLDTATALSRTLPAFLHLWGDFTPPAHKTTAKTKENMWVAIEDYVRTYAPATDQVQPLFLNGKPTFEFSFAIPLDFPGFPRHPSGGPFIYAGRADLLGTYGNRPCIRDEKTTGRLDGNWAEKWDLRAQFLGYCWAAQVSGINCSTVVVRGVVIHKRDIVQVEAIKLYAQWEIERWYEQLKRDLNALVDCWNSNYFDFNLGEACTMYGGCAFTTLCKSEHPSRWYDQYRIERWNPLLRNPIDPKQTLPSVL